MRGIWVDAFGAGVRTPAEVAELVDFACAARLDTLVVQVTRRGDTFANALPLPRPDAELAPRPYDPLSAVCAAAQDAGLDVHAWLAATPVARAGGPLRGQEPWLSRRVDGTSRDRHGTAHIDPGHPDARTFLASCAAGLARHYPVAGVNLDRVRYPGRAWGYNAVALSRYADQTGADDPPAPDDATWQAWRRTQVTALVDETAAAVRAVRDDVTVSTTGTCFGGLEGGWQRSLPWTDCGQDWVGWLRDARVDRVLVMNYRGDADDADLVPQPPAGVDLRAEGAVAAVADPASLRARFDDWARLAVGTGGEGAVLGTGLYLSDVAVNADLAGHVLQLTVAGQRPGGWCGFSYRTPSRQVLLGRRPAGEERARLARELQPVMR